MNHDDIHLPPVKGDFIGVSRIRAVKIRGRPDGTPTAFLTLEVGREKYQAVLTCPVQHVKDALERLEYKRQQVFTYRHLRDLPHTHREIGQLMGFSSARSYQLLRSAEASVLGYIREQKGTNVRDH
jgi:DNA-directed RNA polymerase specialized sigma24 family protein